MLGLTESQLFQKIDHGASSSGHWGSYIKKQESLEPDDMLRRLATGVAKAIEANNIAIENQLRSAGIKL